MAVIITNNIMIPDPTTSQRQESFVARWLLGMLRAGLLRHGHPVPLEVLNPSARFGGCRLADPGQSPRSSVVLQQRGPGGGRLLDGQGFDDLHSYMNELGETTCPTTGAT